MICLLECASEVIGTSRLHAKAVLPCARANATNSGALDSFVIIQVLVIPKNYKSADAAPATAGGGSCGAAESTSAPAAADARDRRSTSDTATTATSGDGSATDGAAAAAADGDDDRAAVAAVAAGGSGRGGAPNATATTPGGNTNESSGDPTEQWRCTRTACAGLAAAGSAARGDGASGPRPHGPLDDKHALDHLSVLDCYLCQIKMSKDNPREFHARWTLALRKMPDTLLKVLPTGSEIEIERAL